MGEMLVNSAFFGALLTIGSYLTGLWIKKKFKKAFLNPLLISILLTVGLLLLLRVDYPTYEAGAKYVSYLLTPATVCLAVPLYEQFQLLKKNAKAVLLGIFSGVLTSLGSIFLLSRLFHATYVTLLPKSITTAIGGGVAEELGGYVSLTVAVILITGVLGNMIAEGLCKLFRITDPIARGVAIGTSSHAIGTAKAMELGEVEGAMSSLSIVVSGMLTVLGAAVFARFL